MSDFACLRSTLFDHFEGSAEERGTKVEQDKTFDDIESMQS